MRNHYRHNSDESLRKLERAASSGDPAAEEALLQARLRAGYFEGLADSLIKESHGKLPIPVIHKLHHELMRYDLMKKLPIYELVELTEERPVTRGLYGSRLRAEFGAARAASDSMFEAGDDEGVERANLQIQSAYEALDAGDEATARAVVTEVTRAFNQFLAPRGFRVSPYGYQVQERWIE